MTWTSHLLYVLPAILLPAAAHADGEHAVSATVGWGAFTARGKKVGTMEPPSLTSYLGATAAAMYERAISGDFSLRGELAGGAFDGDGISYFGLADAGVVYRFDVLKYVPYAFCGIGGIISGGGSIDRGTTFVVALGGGLDILTSRERSWGVEARLASFASDVTVFTLGLRGTIRWGYL